jgi:hypothetical protein
VWIVARLAYFIGELLIARLGGGIWKLNEMPETRTFLHYVVEFPRAAIPRAMVAPFELAAAFVDTPAPRSLTALVDVLKPSYAADASIDANGQRRGAHELATQRPAFQLWRGPTPLPPPLSVQSHPKTTNA